MIQDKILMSTWGGGGGVDEVVANLRREMGARGIRVDVMYNFPCDGPKILLDQSDGTRIEGNWRETIDKINWQDYAVINLHSCNFWEEQIRRLRALAEHAPLIHNCHGSIAHSANTELLENPSPDWKWYKDEIEALPKEKRAERIRNGPFKDWDIYKMQRALVEQSDSVVFLTEFAKGAFRFFHPELEKDENHEPIIPNGSGFHKYYGDQNVERRAAEIKRGKLENSPHVIAFSGRAIPPKGISDLARAFDIAKAKYRDAKLLVIGEGHQDYGGNKAIFDYTNYRKDVVITGWIRDKQELAAHLRAAEVVVIPSYHENFSMSALESLMMGVPLVVSNIDGSREVYVKPGLAYETPPRDVKTMNRWLDYLFENPARARGNAEYQRRVATAKYTLGSVVNTTISLFETALTERYSFLRKRWVSEKATKKVEKLDKIVKKNLPK